MHTTPKSILGSERLLATAIEIGGRQDLCGHLSAAWYLAEEFPLSFIFILFLLLLLFFFPFSWILHEVVYIWGLQGVAQPRAPADACFSRSRSKLGMLYASYHLDN